MKETPAITEMLSKMRSQGLLTERGGPPPPEPLPERSISEKEWMWKVIGLAEELGWRVYHTYDSRRSDAGFPDLILLRTGRTLAAELKTEKGKTTAAQDSWLQSFRDAGTPSFIWRPSDLEEVKEILA